MDVRHINPDGSPKNPAFGRAAVVAAVSPSAFGVG
jgi:hypothetical protein